LAAVKFKVVVLNPIADITGAVTRIDVVFAGNVVVCKPGAEITAEV
jgi:uncharacterized protein (DUF488 family)